MPEAVPDCDGIPVSARRDVLVAPFNAPGVTAEIIDQHHADIAAIIVEPLQRSLSIDFRVRNSPKEMKLR